MPLYNYDCPNCTTEFEQFLPLKKYKTPVPCPTCGRTGRKVITAQIQRDEPTWLDNEVRECLQDTESERPIENRSQYKRYLKENGIVERA
jgi:putative FmdB family regulatory protein